MGAANVPWQLEETEICNDDGFVYKRKRREEPPPREDGDGAPPSSSSAVERRKAALVKVKERYSAEMEQWERFSLALEHLRLVGGGVDPALVPETDVRMEGVGGGSQIEELLRQVEAQVAAIEKLTDICDVIDSLCEIHEEATKKELMGLPIWMTDARSLLAFLSD